MRSILGIDTASPRGSLALLVDGTIRGMAALPPGGHSSGLATLAARLTAEAGISLAALDGIAVSEGPGSFTGLRIGLAWAKGIAVGAGTPLALVSAHESLAHLAISSMPPGDAARAPALLVVTVTPGERKQVELALWEEAAAAAGADGAARARLRPRRRHEAESVPEADLAERIASFAEGRPFVAAPANDAIAELLDDDDIPRREVAPLGASVAMLGDAIVRIGGAHDVASAAPVYGRAPNARKPER